MVQQGFLDAISIPASHLWQQNMHKGDVCPFEDLGICGFEASWAPWYLLLGIWFVAAAGRDQTLRLLFVPVSERKQDIRD